MRLGSHHGRIDQELPGLLARFRLEALPELAPDTAGLCHFQNYLGSRPILVTSGEAWYLPYCNTEETRTAMP
jgi:hypothetical protein